MASRVRAGLVMRWLAITIMLGIGTPSLASEPVRIEGTSPSIPLADHFAVLTASAPSSSLGDVIDSDAFQIPERERLEGGVRWYRVVVELAADMPSEWILAFGEPDIADVRLFVVLQDGRITETHLGRAIPSQDLPLAARHHVAKVSLPQGEPVALYLRLASLHKIRFEKAALWRPDAFLTEEVRTTARLGIHMGMLALVVVGYGLFGLWVRDGAMLLYALYVGTILARTLNHNGTVAILFPSAGGQTNYLLGAIGLLGGLSVFIFMWDRILGLKTAMPTMHRLYVAAGLLALPPLLLAATPAFPIFAQAAFALMTVVSATSVALAAIMVLRKPDNPLLKIYLFAFLPLVGVGIIQMGTIFLSVIPVELGRRLDASAVAIHVVVLGLALGYRLWLMQQDRARIGEELAGERRTQERLRAFIDMVSHEFKTPLAVIDSAAQVIEVEAPGRSTADRVSAIRRSVNRLIRLIDTCLAGERYEALEIQPSVVSPMDIVEQAAERNSLTGSPEVRVTAGDCQVRCFADANLLGIALDALIDNARRYGAADQPVEVAAETRNTSVLFQVSDHGPGIPPAEAPRIFEKFYRCTATVSTAGTGIGLHLVKTIAELHGGTVNYSPRPGGGSVFTLSIPMDGVPGKSRRVRSPAPA